MLVYLNLLHPPTCLNLWNRVRISVLFGSLYLRVPCCCIQPTVSQKYYQKKKKKSGSSQRQNFNLPLSTISITFTLYLQIFIQHSHCSRYYKQSRDDLKYRGECAQVLCKYYTVLQKRPEHLWIWVSVRGPGTNPQQIARDGCTLYLVELKL